MSIRILLVDDEQLVRSGLKLILEAESDLEVVGEAGDGREGVELTRRLDPDVVLMDIQMPELDGLAATQRLRAELPEARQPWVIAMTANAMEGEREVALAAGMNEVVTKPVRIERLAEALAVSRPLAGAGIARAPVEAEPASVEAAAVGATPPTEAPVPVAVPAERNGVIDPAVIGGLLAMLGGSTESMGDLIDTFLDDAPRLLAQLRDDLVAGDAGGVRRIAHGLKSNGADFGATRLTELCRELETVGKSEDLTRAPGLLERIEAEYGLVSAELAGMRRDGRYEP